MNELIRKDIIAILKDAIKALKKRDILALAELSNHINHTSLIFQDEDSISIAVMVYALSKIIERQEGRIDKELLEFLKKALHYLELEDIEKYRQSVKRVFDYIMKRDHKLKLYALHVINQAEIKRGSRLFEHGLSIGRVAELLGLSRWELMNYIGKTNIIDDFREMPNIKDKIEYARKLFHLK